MEAYRVDEEHGKMKKGNLEFTRSPKALHDHILGYVSHRLQCCWQDLVGIITGLEVRDVFSFQ